MSYETNLLLLSFVVTCVIAIILIPVLRRLKVGQNEREDGPQSHLLKQGTPTMGGIIIIFGIIILSIFAIITNIGNNGGILQNLAPIVVATIGFGIIGFIDDFKKVVLKNTKGLKPSYKMLGLLMISASFVVYMIYILKLGTDTYIPFLKTYITLPIYVYIPFAIFTMLAMTNAINLTDGVDGLATTISTILLACLAVIGIIYDVKEVAIFGSILCGACLAFLLFNLHPAKVFMGDTGSLLLGGAIVSAALYLKLPLLLLIIGIIPVIETVSVMMQVAYYKKTGKRIFKMAPIHHHFELSGWRENKVVIVFSLVTLVLCIVGINAI